MFAQEAFHKLGRELSTCTILLRILHVTDSSNNCGNELVGSGGFKVWKECYLPIEEKGSGDRAGALRSHGRHNSSHYASFRKSPATSLDLVASFDNFRSAMVAKGAHTACCACENEPCAKIVYAQLATSLNLREAP